MGFEFGACNCHSCLATNPTIQLGGEVNYKGYFIKKVGNLVKVYTGSGKYICATTMTVARAKELVDSWLQ